MKPLLASVCQRYASILQMAADRPRFYENVNPDAYKFNHDVPINWEHTMPLLGSIGEYYVVARKDRNSEDWYIGGVTNEEAHRVRLNLDFLDEDSNYSAEIYRDSDTAHFRDNQLGITIETRKITRADYLDIWMAPGGGFAVCLSKI